MARTISRDDYTKALSGGSIATGNAQTSNPNDNSNGNQDQDYYTKLKSESYKSLLNSEIQASTAKDQALKYTQNAINNSGYAGQGLAESSRMGIYNNYQQALANAGQQYDNSMMNIAKQEEAQQNDDFESITTLLANASTESDLDNIYNSYVKTQKDKNGNVTTSSDVLNDRNLKQLNLIYQLYKTQLAPQTLGTQYTLSDLQGGTYRNPETNQLSMISKDFQRETERLLGNVRKLNDGDTISLTNKSGVTITLKYDLNNGTFTQVSNINNPTHAVSYSKNGILFN